MKTFILCSLLISQLSYAGICKETWKFENTKNKVLESCELEWQDGGIELVKLQKGCAFPGPGYEACYLLRSCGKYKEIGASLFRENAGVDSYCISGKELEVMSSSKADGVKAFISCEGKLKPKEIRLSDHTFKFIKSCKFPFKK